MFFIDSTQDSQRFFGVIDTNLTGFFHSEGLTLDWDSWKILKDSKLTPHQGGAKSAKWKLVGIETKQKRPLEEEEEVLHPKTWKMLSRPQQLSPRP